MNVRYDIARARREISILNPAVATTFAPVELAIPADLIQRELHFGFLAWNYASYLGGATTFQTEWRFIKNHSELQRLTFGDNGQWASTGPASSCLPAFSSLRIDPTAGGDSLDSSNVALTSGRSPALTPDALYWPVANATSPWIQGGIWTAPMRFISEADSVEITVKSGVGGDWIPTRNTAASSDAFIHFVFAIVSKK